VVGNEFSKFFERAVFTVSLECQLSNISYKALFREVWPSGLVDEPALWVYVGSKDTFAPKLGAA
jgi:hypothetical protein